MNPAVIGVMIPVIAIIFGTAVAVVVIYAGHRQRMQRTEFRHRERLAALEKGLELPPDPAESETPVARRPRHLLRGLVLLLVGGALTAAMYQSGSDDFPYLYGLLPAAAGVAYLLYYFIEGRHETPAANGTAPGLPPR